MIESCAIITVRYYIAVNTTAAGVLNSGPGSLSLINHVEWTKMCALYKSEFPRYASRHGINQ